MTPDLVTDDPRALHGGADPAYGHRPKSHWGPAFAGVTFLSYDNHGRPYPIRPHSGSSRGSTLLIAISFIVMLTMVGALVMRAVRSDLDTAGAERSSQDALYIAEAGLQWGRSKILTDYWSGTGPNYGSLFTLSDPALDPLCDESRVQETNWVRLDSMAYGTGHFCLVVKDDEFADTPTVDNNTFLIRSLGVAADGYAKRLLEVTVTME